jgi:hypothetical protein
MRWIELVRLEGRFSPLALAGLLNFIYMKSTGRHGDIRLRRIIMEIKNTPKWHEIRSKIKNDFSKKTKNIFTKKSDLIQIFPVLALILIPTLLKQFLLIQFSPDIQTTWLIFYYIAIFIFCIYIRDKNNKLLVGAGMNSDVSRKVIFWQIFFIQFFVVVGLLILLLDDKKIAFFIFFIFAVMVFHHYVWCNLFKDTNLYYSLYHYANKQINNFINSAADKKYQNFDTNEAKKIKLQETSEEDDYQKVRLLYVVVSGCRNMIIVEQGNHKKIIQVPLESEAWEYTDMQYSVVGMRQEKVKKLFIEVYKKAISAISKLKTGEEINVCTSTKGVLTSLNMQFVVPKLQGIKNSNVNIDDYVEFENTIIFC